MRGELECEGRIKFGPIPWELSERLAQFSGNWLQFAPEENAVVVKEPQAAVCPAFTAVPCELISLVHSMPAELRASMPGGAFYIRDGRGEIARVVVDRGEIRVQWPHQDYARPLAVPPDPVLNEVDPKTARLNGWARFAGACERADELRGFVETFGGIYPEGDMPSECVQNLVYVRFRDVNVGPRDLIARMMELAESRESVQAELYVGSFERESTKADFRIEIRDGRLSAAKPTSW